MSPIVTCTKSSSSESSSSFLSPPSSSPLCNWEINKIKLLTGKFDKEEP